MENAVTRIDVTGIPEEEAPLRSPGWSPLLTNIWYYHTLQIKPEVAEAISIARRHMVAPRVILEIGAYRRGCLLRFGDAFRPELYLSVTLDEPGGAERAIEAPMLRRWAESAGIDWVEIVADSMHPNSPLIVRDILESYGLEVDILFIDGDHAYHAVMADYNNYEPLVQAGGVVMFHDVKGGEVEGPSEFWDMLVANGGPPESMPGMRTPSRIIELSSTPYTELGIGVFLYGEGADYLGGKLQDEPDVPENRLDYGHSV